MPVLIQRDIKVLLLWKMGIRISGLGIKPTGKAGAKLAEQVSDAEVSGFE